MSNPLIGITTNRNENQSGYPQISINEAYIASLVRAGACPVAIPLGTPERVLVEISDRLDGIVFSGGGDIHPGCYGNPMHPLVNSLDGDRDRVELFLLEKSIERGLPLLGICRGFQVINVGLGGRLYEDILDQRPNSLNHNCYPEWPPDHLAHGIQVVKGSQLVKILEASTLDVNSLHHQGVECLAPGLSATAYASDGLLEAFELPNHPFGLAVQWHPEHLQAYQPMCRLFRAFVEACTNREM